MASPAKGNKEEHFFFSFLPFSFVVVAVSFVSLAFQGKIR